MTDPTPHLKRFDSYEQACREFRWRIPQRFNIASSICRRHADAVTRIALSDVKEGGINTYTFGGLDFLSDKFAAALLDSGVGQGDSIGVVLPPSAALAISHLGALKTGAVVVPLSMKSDAALLRYALENSAAKALIVDESIYDVVETMARNLPNPASCFVVRDLKPKTASAESKDFWSEVDRASSDFSPADIDSNSPALIFYVESRGRCGGIVHSHRSVIGQLAAFEIFNDVDGDSKAVFWTAGDWSSPAAALGVLYPALWCGCSVVACQCEDRADIRRLMEQCEVTNVFMPATPGASLGGPDPQQGGGADLKVRVVVAEAPREPDYLVSSYPGIALSEVRGDPETGWLFGKCAQWFTTPAGSVGRRAPGRSLEIIDDDGDILPPGRAGHIAVHRSDPALFNEYHGDPARTAAAFIGDWFLTGAVGYKSGDGDLYIPPSPSVVGTD